MIVIFAGVEGNSRLVFFHYAQDMNVDIKWVTFILEPTGCFISCRSDHNISCRFRSKSMDAENEKWFLFLQDTEDVKRTI